MLNLFPYPDPAVKRRQAIFGAYKILLDLVDKQEKQTAIEGESSQGQPTMAADQTPSKGDQP